MILLFFYLALALVVSFLCSIVEAVILSVSAPFIKMKEMEGKTSVKYLKNLKNKIDQPLSAILTINTVTHTVGAAGVGAQAVALSHLGTKEGVLKESESQIIDNLIKLKTLNVRDIVTPRTVVVSAPEEISLDDFIKQKEYLQYSRIPVYSGNIDNVTGYILKSDVLEKLATGSRNQKLKYLKRLEVKVILIIL
jgi:CBS domain containing-hemolysin-like protein